LRTLDRPWSVQELLIRAELCDVVKWHAFEGLPTRDRVASAATTSHQGVVVALVDLVPHDFLLILSVLHVTVPA